MEFIFNQGNNKAINHPAERSLAIVPIIQNGKTATRVTDIAKEKNKSKLSYNQLRNNLTPHYETNVRVTYAKLEGAARYLPEVEPTSNCVALPNIHEKDCSQQFFKSVGKRNLTSEGSIIMWLRYCPEPFIFCYFFAFMLQYPVTQQYMYKRYSDRQNLVYTFEKQNEECAGGRINGTQLAAQKKVQTMASRFSVANSFCKTVPAIFSCLLLGVLSEIFGRKKMMMCGSALAFLDSLLVLITINLTLPVPLLFVGSLLNALGGSQTGMAMIGLTYLTDITPREKLPVRIAIMELFVFAGMTISNFLSGPFIKHFSFEATEINCVILHGFSFLWLLFVIKESLDHVTSSERPSRRFKLNLLCSRVKALWTVLVRQRQNKWIMVCSIIILVCGYCLNITVFNIITLYLLNSPFCWPAISIGNFLGTGLLLMAVGTALGVKLFKMFLPDPVIALVAFVSGFACYLAIAFVKTEAGVYGALFFKTFSALHIPIFRAILSSSVDGEEKGAIFAITSAIETVLAFSLNFLFSFSYANMNKIGHQGSFFIIPALLYSVPFVTTLIYHCKIKRVEESPQSWKNLSEKDVDAVEI